MIYNKHVTVCLTFWVMQLILPPFSKVFAMDPRQLGEYCAGQEDVHTCIEAGLNKPAAGDYTAAIRAPAKQSAMAPDNNRNRVNSRSQEIKESPARKPKAQDRVAAVVQPTFYQYAYSFRRRLVGARNIKQLINLNDEWQRKVKYEMINEPAAIDRIAKQAKEAKDTSDKIRDVIQAASGQLSRTTPYAWGADLLLDLETIGSDKKALIEQVNTEIMERARAIGRDQHPPKVYKTTPPLEFGMNNRLK